MIAQRDNSVGAGKDSCLKLEAPLSPHGACSGCCGQEKGCEVAMRAVEDGGVFRHETR